MDTFINVRFANTVLSHKRNSLFPRCITKPQTLRLQDRQHTVKKEIHFVTRKVGFEFLLTSSVMYSRKISL